MLDNGDRSICGFEDAIVSYIYDEVTTVERRRFESHLVDCSSCTDEFASISNPRLSVFEWQKEDFANLSTPEIVIPYAHGTRVVEDDAPAGFLAGLHGLFSGFGVPVAVAAALVICLGAGFLGMRFFGGTNEQIAANIKVAQPDIAPRSEAIAVLPDAPEISASNDPAPTFVEPKPVKTSEIRRPGAEKQAASRASAVGTRNQRARQTAKAPVLTDFDEKDDRSLRLADLFDGIGGGR